MHIIIDIGLFIILKVSMVRRLRLPPRVSHCLHVHRGLREGHLVKVFQGFRGNLLTHQPGFLIKNIKFQHKKKHITGILGK